MEWRRRPGSDVWHHCWNCTQYPQTGTFDAVTVKPTTGEGCNQCISKERKDNCSPTEGT